MTSPSLMRHVLPGLRPEPCLASYLAGRGLIRVIGEQADPAAELGYQLSVGRPSAGVGRDARCEVVAGSGCSWSLIRRAMSPRLGPAKQGVPFGTVI